MEKKHSPLNEIWDRKRIESVLKIDTAPFASLIVRPLIKANVY